MTKKKNCSKFYGYRVVSIDGERNGWIMEQQTNGDIVCSYYQKLSGRFVKTYERYGYELTTKFVTTFTIKDFLKLLEKISNNLTNKPTDLILSEEIVNLIEECCHD